MSEDPSLTMLSDLNELEEEEKQDNSLTNLLETKEELTNLDKSHTNLDNEVSLLESEEKESSNAELPLSQDSKFSLQEKLYSKFKENSPSEDFTLMLKDEKEKKETKKEEDSQEATSDSNEVDSSLPDKDNSTFETESIEKETESNTIHKSSLKKKKNNKKIRINMKSRLFVKVTMINLCKKTSLYSILKLRNKPQLQNCQYCWLN